MFGDAFQALTLSHPDAQVLGEADEFIIGGATGRVRIGEVILSIRWLEKYLVNAFAGGHENPQLRKKIGTEGEFWEDCTEMGKRRLGGRLVHYRHVWSSISRPCADAINPDTADGIHTHSWYWPVDRGRVVLLVIIEKAGGRGTRDDTVFAPALSAIKLAPTAAGHLVDVSAEITETGLVLSASTLPKIARPWGTLSAPNIMLWHSWLVRLRHTRLDEPIRVALSSKHRKAWAEAKVFAEVFGEVLGNLDKFLEAADAGLRDLARNDDFDVDTCDENYIWVNSANLSHISIGITSSVEQDGQYHEYSGTAALYPDGRLEFTLGS